MFDLNDCFVLEYLQACFVVFEQLAKNQIVLLSSTIAIMILVQGCACARAFCMLVVIRFYPSDCAFDLVVERSVSCYA